MFKDKLLPILPSLLASVTLLSACAGTDGDSQEQTTQDQDQDHKQVQMTETSETISFAILGTSDIHAHAPFEPAGNIIFSSSPNAVDHYEDYERIELHEEDADAAYFLYE